MKKKVLSFILSLCILFALSATVVTVNAADDNLTDYSITEPGNVRYIGRGEIDTNDSRTFNWPGAGFEFKFTGTTVKLYARNASGINYFNVIVDGKDAVRKEIIAGWNTICENLENKEHIIKILRSSPANHGTLKFKKLRTDGPVSATEAPKKFIEFIGDSNTTGHGNLGGSVESAVTSDSLKAYTGYILEKTGADGSIIAYSGRGVVKGYDSSSSPYNMTKQFRLEEIYTDWGGAGANLSTGKEHDFTQNQPQVVVVWLGSNDYSVGVTGEEFALGYEAFLKDIRSVYPDAIIICCSKANDAFPAETSRAVVNLGGSDAGFYYKTINTFRASSLGHPSVTDARAIGEELYKYIMEINEKENFWEDEAISGGDPAAEVPTTDTPKDPDEISVLYNGEKINFDVKPIIIDGRTMVPVRAIFEALGATVDWDQETKTVFSTMGDSTVVIQINNTSMFVNEVEKIIDVPAMIIDDRTLVPVRAISEAYECEVGWDQTTKTVTITK